MSDFAVPLIRSCLWPQGSLKFRSFPSRHVAPDTPEEDLAWVATDKTCWLPLIRYRVAFFNSHLRGYAWVHACYNLPLRIAPRSGTLSSRLDVQSYLRSSGSLLPDGHFLSGKVLSNLLGEEQLLDTQRMIANFPRDVTASPLFTTYK